MANIINIQKRGVFMNKLYNSQKHLASELASFLKNVFPSISKPQLKIIPFILIGMISSESVVTSDIVKKLKGDFLFVSPSSTIRRLERFFNNLNFDVFSLYEAIISFVISRYKPKNKNVYLSFDHMFCRSAFTVFLISLRIGKQGIPIWFRCFKGTHDPLAFSTSLIKSGISFSVDLFKSKDCNLIFLADRWFNFCEIFSFIDSLGCTYCIRTKSNISIRIEDYAYSDSVSYISDIEPLLSKSLFFDSVFITQNNFHTKLVVSKSASHNEPFFILTNGSTREAVKHYGFRFGSIECVFKNQKSNGFYLESSKMRNLHAFSTLFGLMCIALLWLTILGVDYSKRKPRIKNSFRFRTSRQNGANFKRSFSLFNTGLFLFNLALDSPVYYLLKCNFILYDV